MPDHVTSCTASTTCIIGFKHRIDRLINRFRMLGRSCRKVYVFLLLVGSAARTPKVCLQIWPMLFSIITFLSQASLGCSCLLCFLVDESRALCSHVHIFYAHTHKIVVATTIATATATTSTAMATITARAWASGEGLCRFKQNALGS